MKMYKKMLSAKNALIGSTALLAVQVQAAVPDDVKTSIMGAKADGLEAGWIVVSVIAALFVIKIVKGLIR